MTQNEEKLKTYEHVLKKVYDNIIDEINGGSISNGSVDVLERLVDEINQCLKGAYHHYNIELERSYGSDGLYQTLEKIVTDVQNGKMSSGDAEDIIKNHMDRNDLDKCDIAWCYHAIERCI